MDESSNRDIARMNFISYSQNFEDIMLWRALNYLGKGFYIDVGAWSPDIDSVTRAFYERGWRGINIEPNPAFHHQLEQRRPRDVNLRVAVSDEVGVLMMNFVSNPGMSTLDKDIAEQHRRSGWNIERCEVNVMTLQDVWTHYVPANQEVHFLKIDVEGFEEAALRGNDWVRCRPWVVVIEATLPMSQVESFEKWEPILSKANYRFVYADGLNRFYIAVEHLHLLPSFMYPPNVFDDFKLAGQQDAEIKAMQAEVQVSQTQAELQKLLNSNSWKMTAPLRWLMARFRLMRNAI